MILKHSVITTGQTCSWKLDTVSIKFNNLLHINYETVPTKINYSLQMFPEFSIHCLPIFSSFFWTFHHNYALGQNEQYTGMFGHAFG